MCVQSVGIVDNVAVESSVNERLRSFCFSSCLVKVVCAICACINEQKRYTHTVLFAVAEIRLVERRKEKAAGNLLVDFGDSTQESTGSLPFSLIGLVLCCTYTIMVSWRLAFFKL